MNSSENIVISASGEKANYFADQSLSARSAGTCDLYLLKDDEEVQLALKERRTGRILGFEVLKNKKEGSIKEVMENASAQSKLLRNFEFLKVTAGIMSPEFTLVPEALFKPGDEEIYFRKNFRISTDTNIHFQHIPAFHLYTIFGVEKNLELELNHLFQDPQLFHYSQSLLTGLAIQKNAGQGKQIWLNIRNRKMDIVVSENRKLHLMNTFSWEKNEDILYYTLFVCEQMEMNPEKFFLFVTGIIDEDTSVFNLLKNYIRNINIAETPLSIQNDIPDFDILYQNRALLFNLVMCE